MGQRGKPASCFCKYCVLNFGFPCFSFQIQVIAIVIYTASLSLRLAFLNPATWPWAPESWVAYSLLLFSGSVARSDDGGGGGGGTAKVTQLEFNLHTLCCAPFYVSSSLNILRQERSTAPSLYKTQVKDSSLCKHRISYASRLNVLCN